MADRHGISTSTVPGTLPGVAEGDAEDSHGDVAHGKVDQVAAHGGSAGPEVGPAPQLLDFSVSITQLVLRDTVNQSAMQDCWERSETCALVT